MSSPKNIALSVVALCVIAFCTLVWFGLFYTVDATKIVVFQTPFSGTLRVETNPGTYMRLGAATQAYRKQDNYSFEFSPAPTDDRSILVQFNDGGKAQIGGNIQWEMPVDPKQVIALHTLYGSQEVIDLTLIRNAVNRAMTYTAPLMSATESYAVRRSEFLQLFTDQLENGIYQTQSVETRQPDPITGELKTIRVVSIQKDSRGLPLRAEESPLKKYSILIQSPSVTHIIYEGKVEAQIQQQRDNIMAIQTAQAEAKKAEQQAITAAKNGEAQAMKAKWDQEVQKATQVTKAEQEKAVAELNAQRDKSVMETNAQRDLEVQTLQAKTAEQYKIEQTRKGEGDANRRSAVMAADNALEIKLNAWLQSQQMWAKAFAEFKGSVVPQIVSGQGSAQSNAATDFMGVMAMKAAKDLSLDMSVGKK